MSNLIRRSDVKALVLKYADNEDVEDGWNGAIDAVLSIPAVDAVEVRHGRWVQKEDEDWAGGGKTMCSRCEYGYSWKMYLEPESFKFCPNCGAKMDEENSDERILG